MVFNGTAERPDRHLCGREDVDAVLRTYKGRLETAMRKDFFSGYCPETRRDLGQKTIRETAGVVVAMQADPALDPYFQAPTQKLEAIGRYVKGVREELIEQLAKEATLDFMRD